MNAIKLNGLLVFLMMIPAMAFAQQRTEKQRAIVLTDISYFEPDDTQSLVRLLLYSNQMDIEGLVATTNMIRRHSVCSEIIFMS